MEIRVWVLRLFSVSWGLLLSLAVYLLETAGFGLWLWIWPLAGGVLCAIGLFLPSLMCIPYRIVECIFTPLGHLLSLIVLFLVFFGVFTPYAFFLRVTGWDPLRLKCSEHAASAWVKRAARSGNSGYPWQF